MGCYKYVWTVNGAFVGNARPMTYKMNSNGTYVVNCKVTDTCNNCDTTFSKTFNISCFTNKGCNWASRNPYFNAWDSCVANQKIYGYIGFNYSKSSCFKYQWSVNGLNLTSSRMMNKQIYSNGYYYVSCKVTDTCSNCDTTFSKMLYIGCFNTSGLNNISLQNLLSVYPNPTKNTTILEWAGQTTNYSVFDLRGQLVWKGQLETGKNTIEFKLTSGMYFIQTQDKNSKSVKLLVE
jgi:hypothetical protein